MRMKVALTAVVLTVASWLGWLGWDQQRNPDGSGPYEAWQVVGLALTLTVVAAACAGDRQTSPNRCWSLS